MAGRGLGGTLNFLGQPPQPPNSTGFVGPVRFDSVSSRIGRKANRSFRCGWRLLLGCAFVSQVMNASGRTPLHLCIACKSLPLLKAMLSLLDTLCPPACDREFLRPRARRARHDKWLYAAPLPALVEWAAPDPAAPPARPWDTWDSPLVTAVKVGWREAVECLLASGKAPVDDVCCGQTALRLALTVGDGALVPLLLDAGASPWGPGPHVFSPMVQGALSPPGAAEAAMRLMLDRGAAGARPPALGLAASLALLRRHPPAVCRRLVEWLGAGAPPVVALAAAMAGPDHLDLVLPLLGKDHYVHLAYALLWAACRDLLPLVKAVLHRMQQELDPEALAAACTGVLDLCLTRTKNHATSGTRQLVHLQLLRPLRTYGNVPPPVPRNRRRAKAKPPAPAGPALSPEDQRIRDRNAPWVPECMYDGRPASWRKADEARTRAVWWDFSRAAAIGMDPAEPGTAMLQGQDQVARPSGPGHEARASEAAHAASLSHKTTLMWVPGWRRGDHALVVAAQSHHWEAVRVLMDKLRPAPAPPVLGEILQYAIQNSALPTVRLVLDAARDLPPAAAGAAAARVPNEWAINLAESLGHDEIALTIGLHGCPEIPNAPQQAKAQLRTCRCVRMLEEARATLRRVAAAAGAPPEPRGWPLWPALVLLVGTQQGNKPHVELLVKSFNVDPDAFAPWAIKDAFLERLPSDKHLRKVELRLPGPAGQGPGPALAEFTREAGAIVHYTALHVACWQKTEEMAALLLSLGASLHTASQPDRLTPLHIALLAHPRDAAVAQYLAEYARLHEEAARLLEARASATGIYRVIEAHGPQTALCHPILTATLHNATALAWAAFTGHLEAFKSLLAAGADLNALLDVTVSRPGPAAAPPVPLHPVTLALVCNTRQFCFISSVESAHFPAPARAAGGARVYPGPEDADFQLHCASRFYPMSSLEHITNRQQILGLILERLPRALSTHVAAADPFGLTALQWALFLGFPDTAKALLDRGAAAPAVLDPRVACDTLLLSPHFRYMMEYRRDLAYAAAHFRVGTGRQYQGTPVLQGPLHVLQLLAVTCTDPDTMAAFADRHPDPVVCAGALPCPAVLVAKYGTLEVLDVLMERPDAFGGWWALEWAVRSNKQGVILRLLSDPAVSTLTCPAAQLRLRPGAAPPDLFMLSAQKNSLVLLKYLFAAFHESAPAADDIVGPAVEAKADSVVSYLLRSRMPACVKRAPLLWGAAFVMHKLEEAFDVLYSLFPQMFTGAPDLAAALEGQSHAFLARVVAEAAKYPTLLHFVYSLGGLNFVGLFGQRDAAAQQERAQEGPQLNETSAALDAMGRTVDLTPLLEPAAARDRRGGSHRGPDAASGAGSRLGPEWDGWVPEDCGIEWEDVLHSRGKQYQLQTERPYINELQNLQVLPGTEATENEVCLGVSICGRSGFVHASRAPHGARATCESTHGAQVTRDPPSRSPSHT